MLGLLVQNASKPRLGSASCGFQQRCLHWEPAQRSLLCCSPAGARSEPSTALAELLPIVN